MAKFIKEKGSANKFYIHGADISNIDFINTDCSHADFTSCNLSGCNFSGADMRHCNLTNANLQAAFLDNADLRHANLLKCDLSQARLWHANLTSANLSEASFHNADLLNTELYGVKFVHVNIKEARFLSRHNFECGRKGLFSKCIIDEKGPASARDGYMNLKQYFTSVGRYDDASWASFKEKQMERKKLLKDGSIKYLPSLFMAVMCGYGERPSRVTLFSIAVIFAYAILYFAASALNTPFRPDGNAFFYDCIYFSIVTFTTLGYGDVTVKPMPVFQMLAGSEAFFGAFIMGLFVFTLARKYSAR